MRLPFEYLACVGHLKTFCRMDELSGIKKCPGTERQDRVLWSRGRDDPVGADTKVVVTVDRQVTL